jgi:hypothetical protein
MMKRAILLLVLMTSWIAAVQQVAAEEPMILTFLQFDQTAAPLSNEGMAQIRGNASLLGQLSCSQCRTLLNYLLNLIATYEAPPCPTCPTCTGFPTAQWHEGSYYMFTYTPGSGFSFAPNNTYYCLGGVCVLD